MGLQAFTVRFRDERAVITIPDLTTTDTITATRIATHAHPHLLKYSGEWSVGMNRFNASGVIEFRKKHVGPIGFVVVIAS